jgi:glucose/arabinose dehydrogenase
MRLLITASLLCMLATAAGAQPVQLVNAFPGLTFTNPLFVTHANDGTNRVFVVQRNGRIRVFPNNPTVSVADTFLNISDRVLASGSEQGLLGLAFHPDYATNGYFYVNYTASSPNRTVVSRFSVRQDNPNAADPNSELRILEINQPFSNHNGGMIMFGTDRYLYVGMGDGGNTGDPQNHAQTMTSLLGKMLRIDVNTTTGPLLYGIPPDNPFVGSTGIREEIYASGLRNPWRFSQDAMTGELWLGDVGQGQWEEIDLILSGRNYGWRCYEGNATYNLTGCGPISTYTFPVKVYPISGQPECAVTGGYIYRGQIRPDLLGVYVYGDYCSGKVWQLRYVGGQVLSDSLLYDAPFSISSFGVDELNELYACNYSTSGSVQRINGSAIRLNTIPVAPVNGSPNLVPPAELTWRSVAASEYWVQVATDGNFMSLVAQDSTLTDTTFSTTGLAWGTRYYWRVRVKSGGQWGSFSHTWSFITLFPPAAVQLYAPADSSIVSTDSIECEWIPASTADDYWFELARDPAFSDVVVRDTSVSGTSVRVYGLIPDSVYYWRVRARNEAGYGPFSAVWSLRHVITGVVSTGGIPGAFALFQNYPNPFNPSTTVRFHIPVSVVVSLKVYDMLGREVATLLHAEKEPGEYTLRWNAAEVASGIYYYRLRAGAFTETRRMMVIR